MITHLERELEEVKSKIFEMEDLAIESILKSVDSLKRSDMKLAEEVIRDDTLLDKLEITIDDDCIRILVTKQPAAIHLRFVLAMLKINTDVERIGDLATNIAKETIKLNGKPTLMPLVDIPRMASLCIEMIRDSFQSISEMDDTTETFLKGYNTISFTYLGHKNNLGQMGKQNLIVNLKRR